jgi:hypothetical protein
MKTAKLLVLLIITVSVHNNKNLNSILTDNPLVTTLGLINKLTPSIDDLKPINLSSFKDTLSNSSTNNNSSNTPNKPLPKDTPNSQPTDPNLDDTIPENYVDILTYDLYKSTLTEDERNDYTFWIKYKNSFSSRKELAKVSFNLFIILDS